MNTEQLIIDCCMKFLKFIENLKDTGRITQDEYDEMTKSKVEFLSSHSYLAK